MYTFLIRGKQVERELFLADWVSRLRVTETNQVYSDCALDHCFTGATVSDISAITSLIGLVEHKYPTEGNHSPRHGTKTFFLDNSRYANHLLDEGVPALDGTMKTLRGIQGE